MQSGYLIAAFCILQKKHFKSSAKIKFLGKRISNTNAEQKRSKIGDL
jgi:ABC-type molybdenum transport system ATPase subunit/photorepair protein PhrA